MPLILKEVKTGISTYSIFNFKIQKKIQKEINEKIEKSQREYFLKEELKAIKEELGMPTDSKSSEYKRFKEAIDKLDLEGEVKEKVEQGPTIHQADVEIVFDPPWSFDMMSDAAKLQTGMM